MTSASLTSRREGAMKTALSPTDAVALEGRKFCEGKRSMLIEFGDDRPVGWPTSSNRLS